METDQIFSWCRINSFLNDFKDVPRKDKVKELSRVFEINKGTKNYDQSALWLEVLEYRAANKQKDFTDHIADLKQIYVLKEIPALNPDYTNPNGPYHQAFPYKGQKNK